MASLEQRRNLLVMKISNRGFSIIEVLFVVGFIAFISMALAAVISNQNKEMKSIYQKSEALELKSTLLQALEVDDVCNWQFRDKVVNTSGVTATQKSSSVLNFGRLYMGPSSTSAVLVQEGQALPGTQTALEIASVTFEDIVATGIPNEYKGLVTVTFANSSLVRSMKPVRVQKIIKVVGSDPAGAKRIETCVLTRYSEIFTVPLSTLRNYHTNLQTNCSNMNTEKMTFDSACGRFCGGGCVAGVNVGCAVTVPGKGFVSGLANECDSGASSAQCYCLK